MNLRDFYESLSAHAETRVTVSGPTFVITFENSKDKEFPLDLQTLVAFLHFLRDNQGPCRAAWSAAPTRKDQFSVYEEKSYRAIYSLVAEFPGLTALSATGGSQTRGLTHVLATLIAFLSGQEFEGIDVNTFFDEDAVKSAVDRLPDSFAQLEAMIVSGPQNVASVEVDFSSIRKEFHSWLVNVRGVAESSAEKYSGTSVSTADNLYRELNPGFPGLYSLRTPEEVAVVLSGLQQSALWRERNEVGGNMYSAGVNNYKLFVAQIRSQVSLPKPFVLLAGISGTGKTRFVREQASRSGLKDENYLLVPVRPDWHEPSDLLGYVSRINGLHFVTTPLLIFMAAAWRGSKCTIVPTGFELPATGHPVTHWLCLDEMNLAPVEQYFADFLAIVETRSWTGDVYQCAPILPISGLNLDPAALDKLCKDLGFSPEDSLWKHFVANGMPLPPNLVVAGTVNMDETTHGFSRKVVDRAFTLDFGEFFPNDFDHYFSSSSRPVSLSFPRWSHVTVSDLAVVKADPDGRRSIAFLSGVNSVLSNSPFSLAFRALNELLIAVRSFAPQTDPELAAVWDDFLMTKLLPRMEGDAEKMDFTGSGESLLTKLRAYVDSQLTQLSASRRRPDLLRYSTSALDVELRTPRTLSRMQQRLEKHNFTSFWP